MKRLTHVEPRGGYRLFLRYADGAEGEVDLADYARRGVFQRWEEPGVFERVHLTDSGAVAWDDQLELCPDALYLKLTGQRAEQVFPTLRESAVDA